MSRALPFLLLLFPAILSLPACRPDTGEDPSPTPTPTQPDPVHTLMTETGTNIQISSRLEFDPQGRLTSASGSMSLRYRYRFQALSESGDYRTDCSTIIDEDGSAISEDFASLPAAWRLDRDLISDSCSIGVVPSVVTYGWDPADPQVLWSNRFGRAEARYTLTSAPSFQQGQLDPPGSGTWITITIAGGTFEFSKGDLGD